jgi:hypothetical protein
MRFLRRGPSIDRETAEALLTRQYGTSGGGTVDARGRTLDAYLAAAAATGRDKEIAGEQAALAAFRAAGLAAPAARTVASRPRPTARRVAVIHAAAVAGLAAGGVALAVVAGVIPGPLLRPPGTPSSSAAPAPVSRAGSSPRPMRGATTAPPIPTTNPSSRGGLGPTPETRTGGGPLGSAPPQPDSTGTTARSHAAPPPTPPAHRPPPLPGRKTPTPKPPAPHGPKPAAQQGLKEPTR